jgi:predicted acetyltransferase
VALTGPVCEARFVPELGLPTVAVRESFLAGERADWDEQEPLPPWLAEAEADFGAFVAARCRPRHKWGVPVTELWYTDGPTYLGTLVIRHRLTPELMRDGGHIGYNVVSAHRRRGHATAMLAQACVRCRAMGMPKLLITCDEDNIGSRGVIEANGGHLYQVRDGICRYWITL